MRISQLLRVALVPLVVLMLAGCGDDSTPSTAGSGDATSATSLKSSAGDSDSGDADSGDGDSSGSVDCDALKEPLAGMIVNWQIVIGLASSSDVTDWADRTSVMGTMSQFGDQLDAIKAQVRGSSDAVDAIEFMQGANEIAQKGISGDAGAAAELKAYLGDEPTAALMKQTPISLAVAGAGC